MEWNVFDDFLYNEIHKIENYDELEDNNQELIENSIIKKYNDGIFYNLLLTNNENSSILKIGYYNHNFYILTTRPYGWDIEECIILFDSKEKILDYLSLDELKNGILLRASLDS